MCIRDRRDTITRHPGDALAIARKSEKVVGGYPEKTGELYYGSITGLAAPDLPVAYISGRNPDLFRELSLRDTPLLTQGF